MLCLYVAVAKKQGAPLEKLAGTVQNDILKEYIARGTYIYPVRPAMCIVTDIFAFLDRQRENRVVLLPFPRIGLYAIGLMNGDAPEMLQRSPVGRLRLVFIPTAPHPFTGYLALILEQELTPLSMGFHDAMKMQFSCGLYLPASTSH